MCLCDYKNILGMPNKGAHSYRFLGLAIVDVTATIGIALLLSYFFKKPFIVTTIFLFLAGIILHRLFCVRTTIDKLLFPLYLNDELGVVAPTINEDDINSPLFLFYS